MSWFASLFAGNKQNSRRGQAMSTTHEAFSLPTSSPVYPSHPDAFNPDTLQTPDPESAMHSGRSFTYPPVSPGGGGSYGYVQTSPGSRNQPGPLLPLHNSPLNTPMSATSYAYPPLPQTWNRLRAWLAREYPELGDTLNYGILPQDLAQIEMQFGAALPAAVRESYLTVDGQEAESSAGCSEGLFFGLTLLPLEDVLEEWRFWREVDDDPATGANVRLREGMQSIPNGWVRKEYSQRGWIPLIADKAGNYMGVDLNPGEGGSAGQVIVFGRDFDTKVVLWKGDGPAGWAKWLASFVEELESGEGYELGGTDASEGSEDGLGYESYYYDGTGRGQGDGGGDTSSGGGLKLTGEYRGWNVLEAWADRSVRKWYESGIADDASLMPQETEKGKTAQKPGLGILDFASNDQNSGSEVIMPVLADISEQDESSTGQEISVSRAPLPTINITKPPAPVPVNVPTAHDIIALPSPPDSTHSSLDGGDRVGDLESGRSAGMRQISQPPMATRKASRPTSPIINIEDETKEALVPLPGSPEVEPSEPAERLPPPPISDITDLLDDSAPMEGPPIVPTAATLDPVHKEAQEDLDALVDAGDTSASAIDPDTTIRLVGGGGKVGVAEEESATESDANAELSEVASINSVASTDSKKVAGKSAKHKKTLSSGLKKIGQLGAGKRKKSSSNVKEATAQ